MRAQRFTGLSIRGFHNSTTSEEWKSWHVYTVLGDTSQKINFDENIAFQFALNNIKRVFAMKPTKPCPALS